MSLWEYRPSPPLDCPVCATALPEWQGELWGHALWRQGEEEPYYTGPLPFSPVTGLRLPDGSRGIAAHCPQCDHGVTAIIHVVNGVWCTTELETPDNAVRQDDESEFEFRVRLNRLAEWLSGETIGSRTTE